MTTPKISVCGAAAVWDRVFSVDQLPSTGEIVCITDHCEGILPGGCAPNIATDLCLLTNSNIELHYPVGKDFDDLGLEHVWINRGIDCSKLTRVSTENSGGAYLFMQPDGKTMCFSYLGAAATALPQSTDNLGDIVVICPVFNQFTQAILRAAIAQKKKIVFTGIGTSEILPYLSCIDVLMVNVTESKALLQAAGLQSPQELLRLYKNLSIFVTHGGEGSCVYSGVQNLCIPTIRANQLADSTGAGDAYTSAVVCAMALGLDMQQAAYLGSACASFAVEVWGGQSACADFQKCMERLAQQYPSIAAGIERSLQSDSLESGKSMQSGLSAGKEEHNYE